ncbi:glycosyltransferase family 39 protein, partial [Candidatus Woesearchaeota archaeon]|nr:glycosyltransferase family 39 protein [Candidatus Woesearchaeota archaeon]
MNFKNKHFLLIILSIFLVFRLILSPFKQDLWWDSAVYLGMGKYFLSFGNLGLFEAIRPPVLPLILGLIWRAGLDPIIFGRILQIIFSLGIIFLTYSLGKKVFGETVGLLSAFVLALSATFFVNSAQLLSDIPSTFFALSALNFFMRDKGILCGFFAALAFLTRFPQGIIFAVLLLLILFFRKNFNAIPTFAFVVAPFFVFNKLFFGSFFFSLIQAKYVIASAGLWIFSQPWHYYLGWLVKENVLFILSFFG